MRQHPRIRKRIISVALLLVLAGSLLTASAQHSTYKIAVLASLYLDSSFDAGDNYRLGAGYPKYAIPGLEFMEGARMALDTLQTQGNSLEYHLYDTRAADQSVTQLIATHRLDSIQLLIGSVSGSDYRMLAEFAKIKNIPFISATYPNEGGVTANPFVVILNPTLYTHCQAIYHFILKNHPTHQLLYIRRPGAMEDLLENYFKRLNAGEGKPLLHIQTINVSDSVTIAQLQPYMDSDRHTVLIAGSLDETFGASLVRACNTLKESYPMTLIGMPTWEGIRALQGPELRQMSYLLTTSFILPDLDSTTAARSMAARFSALTNTMPGDMAYRGYESTYLFTSLLLRYQGNMMSHIGETYYQTYTGFDIKPVQAGAGSTIPDYFENKHIYILRKQNGSVIKME